MAMINGDLYCKTCFKKIFMREGKYSTFEKPLPKDVAQHLTHAASMATPASDADKQPSPTVSRSASVISGSSAPAAASTSAAPSRSGSVSITSAATTTPVGQLQAAIERKDVSQCQSLLGSHGAALLFEPVKSGATVLEWSLTSYMHKATGTKLIEWLQTAVNETNTVLRQNGLVSPLAGKESERQAEESKESTSEGTEAEGESTEVASEAGAVE